MPHSRSWRKHTVALLLAILGGVRVHAQSEPLLKWNVTIAGVPKGSTGLEFEVFDRRSELRVVYTFTVLESDHGVRIPGEFWQRMAVSLRRANVPMSVALDVDHAELTGSGVTINPQTSETIALQPDDILKVTRTVRSTSGDLEPGLYTLSIDFAAAADLLRLSDGETKWTGRFVKGGDLSIRVATPTTLAEMRRYRLTAISDALEQGQMATALNHALALVRLDPNDPAGHWNLGKVYLAQRQYAAALPSLERASAGLRADSSPAHAALAYAYVATGQDQKAEATLRQFGSNEQAREAVARMRQELRTQGVLSR